MKRIKQAKTFGPSRGLNELAWWVPRLQVSDAFAIALHAYGNHLNKTTIAAAIRAVRRYEMFNIRRHQKLRLNWCFLRIVKTMGHSPERLHDNPFCFVIRASQCMYLQQYTYISIYMYKYETDQTGENFWSFPKGSTNWPMGPKTAGEWGFCYSPYTLMVIA